MSCMLYALAAGNPADASPRGSRGAAAAGCAQRAGGGGGGEGRGHPRPDPVDDSHGCGWLHRRRRGLVQVRCARRARGIALSHAARRFCRTRRVAPSHAARRFCRTRRVALSHAARRFCRTLLTRACACAFAQRATPSTTRGRAHWPARTFDVAVLTGRRGRWTLQGWRLTMAGGRVTPLPGYELHSSTVPCVPRASPPRPPLRRQSGWCCACAPMA